MATKDLIEIIAALNWLLEKDHGAVSMMHKKRLESIKLKINKEVVNENKPPFINGMG